MGDDHNDLRRLTLQLWGEKVLRLIEAGRIRTSTVSWKGYALDDKAICLPWFLYAAVFYASVNCDNKPEQMLTREHTVGHMFSRSRGNIYAVSNWKGYRPHYTERTWQTTPIF